MTLTHRDFVGLHPFSRAEVLQVAEALEWPEISYLNAWGVRAPVKGKWAWLRCGLSPNGRRDALLQLIEIECRTIRGES